MFNEPYIASHCIYAQTLYLTESRSNKVLIGLHEVIKVFQLCAPILKRWSHEELLAEYISVLAIDFDVDHTEELAQLWEFLIESNIVKRGWRNLKTVDKLHRLVTVLLALSPPFIDSGSPSSSSPCAIIKVGNRRLKVNSQLVEMTDSTSDFRAERFSTLHQRLISDGFLFIRGVISSSTVQAARTMLTHLANKQAIRANTDLQDGYIAYQKVSSKKLIDGWTVDAETGGIIGGREPDTQIPGWKKVGNSKQLKDVYNGVQLRSFFQQLFGAANYRTFPDCTWLRVKGAGEATTEHVDYYYFYKHTQMFSSAVRDLASSSSSSVEDDPFTCIVCRDPADGASTIICDLCDKGYHTYCHSPKLTSRLNEDEQWHCRDCQNNPMPYWTCWIPLDNLSGSDGRLALIPGSHRNLDRFESPLPAGTKELLPGGYTKSFTKPRTRSGKCRQISEWEISFYSASKPCTQHRNILARDID